jgi:hypothetical protein
MCLRMSGRYHGTADRNFSLTGVSVLEVDRYLGLITTNAYDEIKIDAFRLMRQAHGTC